MRFFFQLGEPVPLRYDREMKKCRKDLTSFLLSRILCMCDRMARLSNMTLADKAKTLRQKRGMNQEQLATASGITQATISRIESGEIKQLKSEKLRALAQALAVTVDYLVDRTKELTPSDIVQSDEAAQRIFHTYQKLSARGRKQLEDFVHFLENQEKRRSRQ